MRQAHGRADEQRRTPAGTDVHDGHVVGGAERALAVEHWLLSAAGDRDGARSGWAREGVAYLRCGGLFIAVRVPGRYVHAAARSSRPEQVDEFLRQALEGGPVIASPGLSRYYVLVPPLDALRHIGPGTEYLCAGEELGVPALHRTAHGGGDGPYWAVAPDSAGVLCEARLAQRLVDHGRACWARG